MDKNIFDSINKISDKIVLNALGVDKSKGLIAIVTAQNQLSFTQSNSEWLAKKVTEGVLSEGYGAKTYYLPNFPNIGEGAIQYNLFLREQAHLFVGGLGETRLFDGFVFIASDIYTLFGMLKGALRANVPCLFLSNGLMQPILINGDKYGLTALKGIAAQLRNRKLPSSILNDTDFVTENLGNDPYCYESNCGALLIQAMGFSLPNSLSVTAGGAAQANLAKYTGMHICKMSHDFLTAGKMLNAAAFKTALAVDLSLGGSGTALVNLIWLTDGFREGITYKSVKKTAQNIAVIIDTKKNFDLKTFDKQGGVYSLINYLHNAQNDIFADYLIFDNKKMFDYCADYKREDIEESTTNTPSFYEVSGNIAQSGIAYHSQQTSFSGSAKVYDSEERLIDSLLEGEIKAGNCVVVTNCGAKSGLITLFKSAAMLKGADLMDKVAIITDGIVPNFWQGVSISLMTPEAYDDTALSYIKDGDKIDINLVKGKLSVALTNKEINIRRKQIEIKKIEQNSPFYLYSKLLSSPENGCTLEFKNNR